METMIFFSLVLGGTMLLGFVVVLCAVVSMTIDARRKPPKGRVP